MHTLTQAGDIPRQLPPPAATRGFWAYVERVAAEQGLPPEPCPPR